jgi:hypothetical protein
MDPGGGEMAVRQRRVGTWLMAIAAMALLGAAVVPDSFRRAASPTVCPYCGSWSVESRYTRHGSNTALEYGRHNRRQ